VLPNCLFATCALLLLGAFFAPAHAQSVTYAGSQTYMGSGLSGPWSVAVDRAGNVFIADTQSSRVVEVPAGGGPQVTVGSGLNRPYGVAVDGAGDVFIADEANNQVVEVPAGGGPQTIVGSGLNAPYGVAVDGAGDVFIADTGNNRVVEVPTGGGPQTTVGSGLQSAYGVAVDGAGDVFIADYAQNQVVEVPAGCTSSACQMAVGSGLSEPLGVAVDGAGNVFIADNNTSQVVEVPAGGGPQTTVGSGLSYPSGVAVDGAGDIFIAGTSVSHVVEVQRVAVNLGNVNVCPAGQTTPSPCSQTITLSYNVAANTTFGTIKAVTQGAPNLDFALASGSTCAGAIFAGSTCSVNVTFVPLVPGARMGAVQLTDNFGNLLATTMIYGIGQGPAISFGPGVQTTVPTTGLINPYGLAVDGASNLFIADPSNQRVVKVPASGGAQTTVGSGLSEPFKVTVDGAGNVYIGDIGLNQVMKVPAGGGPQTTVGSGLNLAYGVAVDGAGDVFIADSGNNRIVEVPADGSPQITVGSGLTDPIAVAVDGAGNVFVADRTGFPHRVVKIPADGGLQTTVVGGLNNPTGVAVDAAGDVFVADFDGGRILEVPSDGGPPTTVGSGMYGPFDMALDGVGNVFIMDWGNSRVLKVQRSQPPTLSFSSTVAGLTSSDSPHSVTIQNIGNQPLNAIAPGLSVGGPNFVQVAGPGSPADCTSSFSLTPGASCDLSISFMPQSVGSLTAAATFTDNALNTSSSAIQSIALQGTGQATQTGLSQTITFTQPAPASASYYSAFTLAAQSTSGLTVTLSVDAGSTSVCSLGIPSVASGVTSAAVAMLSATGICTIDANQAGSGIYDVAAQQQTSATASAIGTSLAVTNTNDSGFGSLRDALANAVSGDTINFSLPSPATITLASTLTINTSLTITGSGASSVAISGNNAVQVMSIGGGTTVSISGVTIENGSLSTGSFPEGASIYGGGIANAGTLTLSNCVVSGNSAGTGEFPYYSSGYGGGIFNSGMLTLSNCTVAGNSASVGEFGFNVNAYGGGIFNSGTLTLLNSTISGNSSNVGAFAYYGDGYGGGLANSGTLTLLNSTISGNSSNVGGFGLQMSVYGGGIANAGTLTLSNTTISGNSASVGSWESGGLNVFGGGIANGVSVYSGANTNVGTLTAKNSIVANNPAGGNCGGTIASEGYNLSDDATCAAFFTQSGDLNSTAAGLDPSGLKANGSPTQTIALLTGSPAVDAIPMSPINYCTDTSGNPVTTDQSGVARPQGSACDIGAVEVPGAQAGQTSQTLSFTQGAPGTASYNSTFRVGAQSSSGLTVTLSVDSTSSSVCTLGAPGIAGGVTSATVTMTSGTGTCTIFALQSGDATYSAAPLQHTSAAAQQSGQSITFTQSAPAQAIYNSTFTVAATASSGQMVLFSSSGACSNVDATFTMTAGIGTCTVIANQSGNTNYQAAPTVTQTVTANPASQTISFTQSAPAQAPYNSTFTVAASASSGQPVSFTNSGVCGNVDATFTMTSGIGTCAVIANQSGNANYLAAPPVTETTAADKPAQTVTFTGAPATAPYQSTFTVTATTNSGIAPIVTATGSCSINGTTVSMTSGTGPCTMTAKWVGNTNYLATTVTQTTTAEKLVSPATWNTPASITYGTALSRLQLDATANIGGSFVYSPAAGTVPKAGNDTLKVTFTPTFSKDYTTVTASVELQVNQAAPIIAWAAPAAIAYGTALSGTQLNATASVAGKFVYSPAAGKVLTAGTQPLSVTFTPIDHVDYSTATGSATLVVNRVGTSTTITSNTPNPSTRGKAVSVHFTVTAATDYKAPTGKATVNASTGESCTGTLINGSGSCLVTFNTAGSRTLTTTYAGDTNNNSSISAGVAQTVN
jgi:sugar lactone lactonase YvrE